MPEIKREPNNSYSSNFRPRYTVRILILEKFNNVLYYPSRLVVVPKTANIVPNLLATRLPSRPKRFLIQKRFFLLLKELKMPVAQGNVTIICGNQGN